MQSNNNKNYFLITGQPLVTDWSLLVEEKREEILIPEKERERIKNPVVRSLASRYFLVDLRRECEEKQWKLGLWVFYKQC